MDFLKFCSDFSGDHKYSVDYLSHGEDRDENFST